MRNTWLVALLIACGGGSKSATEGSGSGGKAGSDLTGDCRTDAMAVGKFLAETPHEASFFMAQPGVQLVKRPDLPIARVPVAPVVIASSSEIWYRGQSVEPADLQELLRADHTRASERPIAGVNLQLIYLHLDEKTPWSTVVDIVRAAETAGFSEPAFLFDTGFKLTPPPRSKVDDELDALQRDDRAANKATALAEITRGVIQSCPSMITLFGNAPPGADIAQHLIDGVPKALIDCDCDADVAAVRSVLWRVLASSPTIQAIAFDATTRSEALELPGTTTWLEASKKILAGTKGLRLIAK